MLFSPAMRNAVLQATAICTISLLYKHYMGENIFDRVTDNKSFKNLANIIANGTSAQRAHNAHLEKMESSIIPVDDAVKHTGNASDGTLYTYYARKNQTEAIETTKSDTSESFYGRELPREIVISFILAMLQYWWLVGLERILPARPRRRDTPHQGKEQIDESEDREEEVVKKWIAQGRVKRASLHWCNTLLKWVLDVTVGILGLFTAEHVLRQLLKLNSPMLMFKGLKSHLIFNVLGTYLSVAPLVRLIAFVTIPAYKQLIFIEGIQLVWTIFAMQFVRMIASWAVNTELVQEMMLNVTGELERNSEKFQAIDGREL